MFAVGGLLIFGVFALDSVNANRVIRSPDKMEINIPTHSYDRESGEYQATINEEAAYWQGQGDKLGDKEEEGQGQVEEDRDKTQTNYENEKDHFEQQQHSYHKKMNETYQDDRNKTEAHHESNQEHYNQYHVDSNYDNHSPTNKTAEDLTETETVDRYEDKGTEYIEDGQNKVENYDVNAESPSFSYTKT